MAVQLGTAQSDLSRFTADFWEDKVYIGKRVFPAGYFMIPLLRNDGGILSTIGYSRNNLWPLIDQLERGFVNRQQFDAARDNLHELCDLAGKLEPFCYLNDTRYEHGWIDFLFRESQYLALKRYLIFRGEQAELNWEERAFYPPLPKEKQNILCDGKKLYDHIMRLLRFYACSYDDGIMMRLAADALAESLDGMQRLDERTLIEAACKLFPQGYSYHSNEENDGKRITPRLVRADVEYVALRLPDSRKKKIVTAKRIHFERWIDFIITDFFEGLHHCHYPKKCAVCGAYFLIEDGRNRLYCDGIDPKDAKGRSCRQVGADWKRRERENPKVHPVKEACRQRINTINQHRYRGKITKEYADAARRIAQDCRDRALMDAEYARTQYKEDISQAGVYAAVEKAFGIKE